MLLLAELCRCLPGLADPCPLAVVRAARRARELLAALEGQAVDVARAEGSWPAELFGRARDPLTDAAGGSSSGAPPVRSHPP